MNFININNLSSFSSGDPSCSLCTKEFIRDYPQQIQCRPCYTVQSKKLPTSAVAFLPPAARLVCVELNPGPETRLVVHNAKAHKKKKKVTEVVVHRQNGGGGKLRDLRLKPGSGNGRRGNFGNGGGAAITSQYLASLSDPFDHEPPPLGFGTMVQTNQFTGYFRQSTPIQADGSFALLWLPTTGTNLSVFYNNALSTATPNWTALGNYPNTVTIQGSVRESRVISGGIRALVMYPQTSAPGVLFSGLCPVTSQADFTLPANNTNVLCNANFMHLGPAAKGTEVCFRPIDFTDYEMSLQTTIGFPSPNTDIHSALFICGQNFPVGAANRVWVEAVINIEGIPNESLGLGGLQLNTSGDAAPVSTVSDENPSADSLWSKVKSSIQEPYVFDFLGTAAGSAANYLYPGSGTYVSAGIGGIGRLLGLSQKFGNHSAARKSYANQKQITGGSVLIEEMD
jgi:hypothetical protein